MEREINKDKRERDSTRDGERKKKPRLSNGRAVD